MKKSFLLMAITALTLTMFSCKKDDAKSDNQQKKLELEGTWIIKNINFTTEEAKWQDSLELTVKNLHNYAPFMFVPMNGVEFTTTDLNVGNVDSTVYLGKILKFISNRTEPVFHTDLFDTPEESGQAAWWFWNYSEDGKSFSTGSVNPNIPSPTYIIKDVTDVDYDGTILKFKAIVPSKILGSGNTYQDLPVEMTFVRGSKADIGTTSPITIMGVAYNDMPEQ
ncbi:MAG: hypothetical protein M9887_03685 [Chitinophagales bacterium]|nr:hypothetical protein [Chitinophagales bacterium]